MMAVVKAVCSRCLGIGLGVIATVQMSAVGSEAIGNKPWDYPLTPGSIRAQLLTPSEVRRQCQIPAESAKAMSTPALMDLCMRYPYLVDVILYSRPEDGFESVVLSFRGFEELFRREDFGAAVLSQYRDRVRESRKSGIHLQAVEMVFLNTMLTSPRCLGLLNVREKADLANLALHCLLATRGSSRGGSASESFIGALFFRLMSSPGVVLKTSLREYTVETLPAALQAAVKEGAPMETRRLDDLVAFARQELRSDNE